MLGHALRKQLPIAFFVAVTMAGSAAGTPGSGQEGPGFQISGRLISQDTSEPLAGKVIAAQIRSDGAAAMLPARVSADGDFVISGLEDGPATVIGIAEGYGRSVQLVTVDVGGVQEVILSLPRGVMIEGTIRDSRGTPLEDVELAVRYMDHRAASIAGSGEGQFLVYEGSWEITTDDPLGAGLPGVFTIRDIDPNRPFEVIARHSGFDMARYSFPATEAGTRLSDVEFVLR